MINESETNQSRSFVTTWLPWLLGGGMLVLYLITLGRSVSVGNLLQVLDLSGLLWRANISRPVNFLVFYPFRWLPATILPLAVNFFTAICGALTLALLA